MEDIHCLHGDGISIGSEMSGGVSNVVVRNVKFNDVLHPMRIKTGYGRGGTVKNVLFENIELATLGQACGTGITVDEFDGNILPNANRKRQLAKHQFDYFSQHSWRCPYRGVVQLHPRTLART